MKYKELQGKQKNELRKLLSEQRKALRLFNFSVTGGKSRNVKEGREIKKGIARILTKLREME